MVNLLAGGNIYLHNRAETFVNYAKTLGTDWYKFNTSSDSLAKEHFEKLYNNAITKEKQFYALCGVTSAAEWSNKFTARDLGKVTELNLGQFVQHLLVSPDLSNFLNTRQAMEEKFKGIIPDDQLKDIIDNISKGTINLIEKELYDYIPKLLLGEKEEIELKTILQEKIPKEAGKKISKKDEKKFYKEKSRKFKHKFDFSKEERKERVIQYVEMKLHGKDVPQENIDTVSKIIRKKLIITDEKNSVSDFLGDNYALRIGGQGAISNEIGFSIILKYNDLKMTSLNKDISYIKACDDIARDIELQVEDIGEKKVNRVGLGEHQVQSKIDKVFKLKDKNSNWEQVFKIQEKNTSIDYFDQVDNLSKNTTSLDKKVKGFAKLHDEISFNTFVRQIEESNAKFLLTDDQITKLTYILVNLNILNNARIIDILKDFYQEQDEKRKLDTARIYKRNSKLDYGEAFSSVKIQQIINDIFSRYVELFMSDINGDILDPRNINTWDFLLFKNRILIPASAIYRSIYLSLTSVNDKLNEQVKALNVTTSAKFSAPIYRNMLASKYATTDQDEGGMGFKPKMDHQTPGFDTAGQLAGNQFAETLKITGVKLNFNIENFLKNQINDSLNNLTSGL